MDISKMRVNVRKFSSKQVEQDKIDKILEAGRWAPTAVNGQPQRILVLNTEEQLEKVRRFCTYGYSRKYAELAGECSDGERNVYYYGAPLVLFICYDRRACWVHPETGAPSGPTDAVIVATHMMLEAASLGLGTVWISYFDGDKAKNLLHVPADYEPVSMLYAGYPAEDFKPNPKMSGKRLPLTQTCFYGAFLEEARR